MNLTEDRLQNDETAGTAFGPAREVSLVGHDRFNKSGTIMIVDDEPVNIKVVQKYLRDAGHESFVTTTDSREAMDLIREKSPDVIVLDIMMPHISGLHILEAVRGDIHLHHIPVLVLTASADEDTKLEALDLGASDFLSKPVKPAELVPRVRNALVLKSHYDQQMEYGVRLENEVAARTAELSESRRDVIRLLACAAEYRDRETGNHIIRVGRYAAIIASQLGFSPKLVEQIELAAILHDVGKVGIPDEILLKPARLNDAEFEFMRRHCEFGANILRGVSIDGNARFDSVGQNLFNSPILLMAATISISHHEKWDGSGYPLGLAGEAIPIEGRITAVADVFDALSSRRPYKEPTPVDRCFEILEEGRGAHFDPKILDAFFAREAEVIRASVKYAD